MKIECTNPGCTHTARSLTVKLGLPGSGVKEEDQWFCSRRCYRNYLADRLIADKRSGLGKSVRRVKLGLLLVKNKLIDKDQLTAALEQRSGSSKKLGEILVESGRITEKELKAALSMQAGVAPINLDPRTKIKLKEVIPFKIIDEYHFVLFDFDEEDKTISAAVYDMDYIAVLEKYFSRLYPGYLSRFFLEDKKKILSVIAFNYPEEKLSLQVEEELSRPGNGAGSDMEKAVVAMVEFLNRFTGNQVKIDSLDNAVWLKGKTENFKIDIYLTKK
jgi:hypothetical protein